MKALSVKNPWAALIAAGRKSIELRTWTTSYRGPIVIVSSATPSSTTDARKWETYRHAPTSRAVALVELLDVRMASRRDAWAACCPPDGGEYAWCLRLVRRLTLDVHVRGQLSLFQPPADLLAALRRG